MKVKIFTGTAKEVQEALNSFYEKVSADRIEKIDQSESMAWNQGMYVLERNLTISIHYSEA